MKALQLLGLNHRLRFDVPDGGAVVVLRHPRQRVHLHFEWDTGGTGELSCETLEVFDDTSAAVFPFPVEVYDVREAMLGSLCVRNLDARAIDECAKAFKADGLSDVAPRELEPALLEMNQQASNLAQAKTPLELTEEQRRGAVQFFTGFMADMISARIAGREFVLRQVEADCGEATEEAP